MNYINISKFATYLPFIKTMKNYKNSYIKSDLVAALTVAVVESSPYLCVNS